MKLIFHTLTIYFLLQPIASTAQLEWINPKPTGHHCYAVKFIDQQNGLILNQNGDLLSTSDQGVTWNFFQNFPGTNALDIEAKSGTGIISTVYGFIWISKDNGRTWLKKNTGLEFNFSFVDVVSKDTLFIGNTSGKIFRSDDGGNTWKQFNCGSFITRIEFINSKVGFAGTNSTFILKTEDGGLTWQRLSFGIYTQTTYAINFYDLNIGYVNRGNSELLSTKDGGKTWSTYTISDNINSFNFVSADLTYACSENGKVYRTINGGLSWEIVSSSKIGLRSLSFVNDNIGFAVGLRGRIIKTIDGGNTWNSYVSTYDDIKSLNLTDKRNGFATAGGKLYKLSDGFTKWTAIPFSDDAIQYAQYFNQDTGIITTKKPFKLFKTFNGGSNWQFVSSSQYSYDDLLDAHFLNNGLGFMNLVDLNGTMNAIIKTRNFGQTWQTIWQPKYSNEFFNKIYFVDERTGYASSYGSLYRTDDSANNWMFVSGGSLIQSIYFVNERMGFVAGNDGLVRKTSDSGRTWKNIEILPGSYDHILGIKFFNEQVGYLTLEKGIVFKSIDSGETWKKVGSGSIFPLPIINFFDSTVYFAGGAGAILSTKVEELELTAPVVYPLENCKFEFRSKLTTAFDKADSISFEFGMNSFDENRISATPNSAQGVGIEIKGFAGSLYTVVSYMVRARAYFKGNEILSPPSVISISEVQPPTVVTPLTYCLNEVTPPLTAVGTNLRWHDSAWGGSGTTIPPIPNTADTGTRKYWVSSANQYGCESYRPYVTVIVKGPSPNLANSNTSQTLNVTSATSFSNACNGLIVKIEPNGLNPVSGNITSKVWLESSVPSGFVNRHYEITPILNPGAASARLTLFFTQSEFNAFNALNQNRLPTSGADAAGIGRILIEKRSGVSSNGTGLPQSYTGTITTIDPRDEDIVWNTVANRWEVSVNVDGFSGFFVKTSLSSLPVKWEWISSSLNSQQQPVINWKVQEINVAKYVIEKSLDGISYRPIGEVGSKGDGTNTYRFIEQITLIHTSYYRIKQIDQDNKFSYSSIEILKAKGDQRITVYPNPFSDKLILAVSTELVNTNIQITSVSGAFVRSARISNQTSMLDLTSLPAGVYLLKFENGKVERIVKY